MRMLSLLEGCESRKITSGSSPLHEIVIFLGIDHIESNEMRGDPVAAFNDDHGKEDENPESCIVKARLRKAWGQRPNHF